LAVAKTKKLVLNALLLALIIISMYSQALLQTVKITLIVIPSLLMGVSLKKTGFRSAIILWISASILSFIVAPYKISAVLFFIFFGLYPIIKDFVESHLSKKISFIIKFIFFNISMLLIYLIYILLITPAFNFPINIFLIIGGLYVAFIIYDYFFSFFIQWLLSQTFFKNSNLE